MPHDWTQPTIVRIEEATPYFSQGKVCEQPNGPGLVVPEPFQVSREEIDEEREGEQRGLWHQSIHVEQQAVDVINQQIEEERDEQREEIDETVNQQVEEKRQGQGVLQQFIQAEQQVVDVINQQIEEERDEQEKRLMRLLINKLKKALGPRGIATIYSLNNKL